MKKLTRDEAWNLLTEYNQKPELLKHALAVEAVMRHFARLNGEDEELWGIVGLLHDLDYEQYPDEHCKKGGGNYASTRRRRVLHSRCTKSRLRNLRRYRAAKLDGKDALYYR